MSSLHILVLILISENKNDEMERLRSVLHEQGREIDQLKMENQDQRQRIKNLELCLEEEMKLRQGCI